MKWPETIYLRQREHTVEPFAVYLNEASLPDGKTVGIYKLVGSVKVKQIKTTQLMPLEPSADPPSDSSALSSPPEEVQLHHLRS